MIVEVAVVGTGMMGTNHARVLSLLPNARLSSIVDEDADRARAVAAQYGCSWTTELEDLAGKVDAVVLAVPTEEHHRLALRLLSMDLHLLVEKPLASTVEQAAEIVDLAESRGLVLGVGHIERFNPACLDLHRYVDRLHFVQTRRFSPYTPRIGEGVVRDMMIHDVDIVLFLAGAEPIDVTAQTIRTKSETEDMATATVRFASGLVAQMTASRVAQHKVRQLDLIQEDSLVNVDLLRQDITIHRKASVEFFDDGRRRLRESSMVEIPYLSRNGEPLWIELDEFCDAVGTGRTPRVDGEAGLAALRLCERIVEASQGSA